MTPRLGRCWNQDLCSTAQNRAVIVVPAQALFVCPECARPLRPAAARGMSDRRMARLVAAGIVLAAAVGLYGWWQSLPTRIEQIAAHKMAIGQALVRVVQVAPTPAPPTTRPPAPVPVPVPVQPPAKVAAPPPVAASVTAPTPRPASVLMRLRGEAVLANAMLPSLARAFLQANGDADVTIEQQDGRVAVVGRGEGGLEAVTIQPQPAADAFASMADGGAEMVFALRAPTAEERRALSHVRAANLAATSDGTASLYVPEPADPTAAAFMGFATSAGGRAALTAAGYKPPAPTQAPKAIPAQPDVAKAPEPEAPPVPTPAPSVAKTAPAPTEVPPAKVALPAPLAPAPAAPVAAAPEPGPRTVRLGEGSRIVFGPLKNVDIPTDEQRMIFLPANAARQAPGSMQVDCLIQTSGVPKDCRQLSAHGASAVSGSILAWLGSGAIRYSPALKNGAKVEERRVLTVNFRQPSAEQ